MQQAIYCFTQAIKADKEDVDTMWDRAVLLKLSDAKTMVHRRLSTPQNAQAIADTATRARRRSKPSAPS